ncbi:hypothetical protein VB264_10110 [Arcicella aquatica]|uniref:Uncharacterized protein n=1 Tax=Arcicella aquatica TaxID=217141 RepID=A0ABU5QM38_9BACT|nr:hypothetical protein [Arcicella aquatica]MEA5258133.1 hypothetical protein [Arcicella aquatica]
MSLVKNSFDNHFFDVTKVQIQNEYNQIWGVTKKQQRYKGHKQEGNNRNK